MRRAAASVKAESNKKNTEGEELGMKRKFISIASETARPVQQVTRDLQRLVYSVQCNSAFLPAVIVLTLYYHRGSRLNPIKSFCPGCQCSHLNILTIFPPDWMDFQKVYMCLGFS